MPAKRKIFADGYAELGGGLPALPGISPAALKKALLINML
jgi:hypothetical protein